MSNVSAVAEEATPLVQKAPALKASYCACTSHHIHNNNDNVIPFEKPKTLLELREEAERNPLGTYCPHCPSPYHYWGP